MRNLGDRADSAVIVIESRETMRHGVQWRCADRDREWFGYWREDPSAAAADARDRQRTVWVLTGDTPTIVLRGVTHLPEGAVYGA